MRILLAIALLLAGGGTSMASPAEPVSEPAKTILVEETELQQATLPADGASDGVLLVRGRPLADRGAAYPRTAAFSDERVTVRLYAAERHRVSTSDIIVIEHIGHSVGPNSPTHLIADVITPEDRTNDALMRIATRNPAVPVLHIRETERLLTEYGAPYTDDGYRSLADRDIEAIFSPIRSEGGLTRTRYSIDFYSTTGAVSAEWTLRVDLDTGSVEEVVLFEEEPPPSE
jgi:hypothetical protein